MRVVPQLIPLTSGLPLPAGQERRRAAATGAGGGCTSGGSSNGMAGTSPGIIMAARLRRSRWATRPDLTHSIRAGTPIGGGGGGSGGAHSQTLRSALRGWRCLLGSFTSLQCVMRAPQS